MRLTCQIVAEHSGHVVAELILTEGFKLTMLFLCRW